MAPLLPLRRDAAYYYPAAMAAAARAHKYVEKDDFEPGAVGQVSVACKSLCMWVIALSKYAVVSQIL